MPLAPVPCQIKSETSVLHSFLFFFLNGSFMHAFTVTCSGASQIHVQYMYT